MATPTSTVRHAESISACTTVGTVVTSEDRATALPASRAIMTAAAGLKAIATTTAIADMKAIATTTIIADTMETATMMAIADTMATVIMVVM
jgi:hypothetical protein